MRRQLDEGGSLPGAAIGVQFEAAPRWAAVIGGGSRQRRHYGWRPCWTEVNPFFQCLRK